MKILIFFIPFRLCRNMQLWLVQLLAVLKKSWLLKIKAPIGTAVELLLPIVALAALVFAKADLDASVMLMITSMVVVLCYSFTLSGLASVLVTEREQRISEMMKILGLRPWILYTSWFIFYAMLYTAMTLVVVALLVPGGLLPRSHMGPVFFLYWLYAIGATAFSMAFSTVFDSPNVARSMSLMVLYICNLLSPLALKASPAVVRLLMVLFPPLAFGIGQRDLQNFEQNSRGLTLQNMFDSAPASAGAAVLCMAAGTVLYFHLYLYLDQVLPHSVGTRRPIFFFVTDLVGWWRGTRRTVSDRSESESLVGADSDDGVIVSDLTKVFGTQKALDSVSLELKAGELTVLLGRNGAGKSTLINILTGMSSASSGRAYVMGHSVSSEMDLVRKNLGVCPQHDILWPSLTVGEHFDILGRIRGLSGKLIKERQTRLCGSLGLVGKEKSPVSTLSGGMKRKLSVGLAFLGDSKFVILDEPTSGLDPLSRRLLWDVLGKLRQDRVLLLSTHYMDEAEVLGERVLILSEGVLKAQGTVNELKLEYGCGYDLTLTLAEGVGEISIEKVRQSVKSIVGESGQASYVGAGSRVIRITVGIDAGAYLEPLIALLAATNFFERKVEIVSRRLEEVFMKVSLDTAGYGVEEGTEAGDQGDSGESDELVLKSESVDGSAVGITYVSTGLGLFWSQVVATFMKKVSLFRRDLRSSLLHHLVPLVTIALGLGIKKMVENDLSAIGNDKDAREIIFAVGEIGFVILTLVAFTSLSSAVLENLHEEARSQSKFLQYVAGLSPAAYWTGTFVADALQFVLITAPLSIGMIAIAQLKTPLEPLVFLLFLFGPAMLVMTYLVSVIAPNATVSKAILYVLNTMGGLLGSIACVYLRMTDGSESDGEIATMALRFLPPFNLTFGLLHVQVISLFKVLAGLNGAGMKLPSFVSMSEMDAVMPSVWGLVIVIPVYLLVTILVDDLVYKHFFSRNGRVVNAISVATGLVADQSVAAERVRAANGGSDVILRAVDVSKQYSSGSPLAVDHVPLAIAREGEIFTILGENGAGKTTLIKLAIGEILPSQGDVFVDQYNSKTDLKHFRQLIGYCPQFDALINSLTVSDHLRLYARIKGVQSVDRAVRQILDWLGLADHAHKKAQALSGGYKRRLSLAMAMMGSPSVVLLDEPSCGMDPVARRQMWKVMQTAAQRCAVVLTTHSMEEAESVSTRLGIMSKGRMICLGSASELREKYSNGIEVFLQTVAVPSDEAVLSQVAGRQLDLLGIASNHSEKRRSRFLASGMGLVGAAGALSFAQWWAQETLNDEIEFTMSESLKGIDSVDASGRSLRLVVMPPKGIVDLDFVGSVFAVLSALNKKGLVADFSLTQNSLDQVFRSVAAQELEVGDGVRV